MRDGPTPRFSANEPSPGRHTGMDSRTRTATGRLRPMVAGPRASRTRSCRRRPAPAPRAAATEAPRTRLAGPGQGGAARTEMAGLRPQYTRPGRLPTAVTAGAQIQSAQGPEAHSCRGGVREGSGDWTPTARDRALAAASVKCLWRAAAAAPRRDSLRFPAWAAPQAAQGTAGPSLTPTGMKTPTRESAQAEGGPWPVPAPGGPPDWKRDRESRRKP